MITVSRRAHVNTDRAGDPLDGLVNLFDVGIVLAVAFLIAALSSLNLTDTLTNGLKPASTDTVTVQPGQESGEVPDSTGTVIGEGSKVGDVYRLSDGRLVYVTGDSTSTAVPTPTPTSQ